MIRQNLHTHTVFCDGRDTPEEMVAAALADGFDSIGFSGHAYLPIPNDFAMTREGTREYLSRIAKLKADYRGRIAVLAGIEYDACSEGPLSDFDYVIGSVHYVKKDGVDIPVDLAYEDVRDAIAVHFDGDPLAYARAYYENVVAFAHSTPYDIVGHFDLLTKFEERENFFGARGDAYRALALEALHAVAEKKRVFEVNTGAIARGYRKAPYPAPFLLREMHALGVEVVLTSDCHDARMLRCHFPESLALLRETGFRHVLKLTENGWEGNSIL